MDNDVETRARAFMAEIANGDSIEWSEFHDRVHALPEPVARVVARLKYQYDRLELEKEFTPEKAGKEVRTASPSGKYEIAVTPYDREKGFGRTRAAIYEKDGNEWRRLPCDVKRNFAQFPFLFIEGHVTGHDFLVCGEDYQCSTVLELDTGRRRDYVPFEEVFGWGFCWASYEYDAASQLLVVEGCIWACPYEYRFYDFSNPMEGWPQLEVIENGEPRIVDVDSRPPLIEGNMVTVYDTADPEEGQSERIVKATWTFERVDNKLILQSEWVSERERQDRKAREEANRVYQEWMDNFKATDPLYVLLTERSKDWPGSREPYSFHIGVVHDNWCPTYKSPEQKERRVGRKVVYIKKVLGAEIEWGVDTGPIKVDVQVEGKALPTKWFMEHSTVAMTEALNYVEAFVESTRT